MPFSQDDEDEDWDDRDEDEEDEEMGEAQMSQPLHTSRCFLVQSDAE